MGQARAAVATAEPITRARTARDPRWRGCLLGATAALVIVAVWLHAAGPWAGAGSDFFRAYLGGAQDVAAGINPYHHLLEQAPDTRLGDSGVHARGYVYPPLLALLLSLPLRFGLDARAIWLLWNALGVAAVIWMGRELNLALRSRRDWPAALAFAAASLLPAVVSYDLSLGQADVLMAALAVGACGLWLRRNPWCALPLGVAVAVKPTMALVLLIWLWKGDWRNTLRGLLASAALILLPFCLIGLDTLRIYLTFYTRWNAFSANAEFINQSPYGFLLRALTPNPYTRPIVDAPWLVTPLRLLAMGTAVLVWARAVPRVRAASMRVGMAECLLAFPLILLASPLAEDIHFCLLAPVLAAFAYLALAHRGERRAPLPLLALPLVFAATCLPRAQEIIYPDHLLALAGQGDPRLGPLVVLLRSGALLAVAVLALLLGARLLRSVRADTAATEIPSTAQDPPALAVMRVDKAALL